MKMTTIPALLILCLWTTNGGGVTKTSGVKEFWTDDFKVFEQVYGKTSDKDLYGVTLPPTITFTLDMPKSKLKASEKRLSASEKRLSSDDHIAELQQQMYPYVYGDRYAKLFAKSILQPGKKTSSNLKFVGVNRKPISASSDPETYNYLKRLEQEQKIASLEEGIGDFTPYVNIGGAKKLEDTEAYKSIQDILDAHEANKNGSQQNDAEQNNYLRYGTSKGRSKVRLNAGNNNDLRKGAQSKCRSGRCRKRSSSSYRVGARPYLRRIKQLYFTY